MARPPLTAHPYGLDRQAHEAPREGPIEQHSEHHFAPLHGAFPSMPAPAQLQHGGQGGASQAPLMVDKLPGQHRDQHDANKGCGACGPRGNHAVDRICRQIYWLDGQRLGCIG